MSPRRRPIRAVHLTLLVFVFLLGSLGLSACKATVEGEDKKWTANVEASKNYAAKYPNFKAVLEAHTAEVQAEMDAAKALTDEEKKVEAMKAANERLDSLAGAFERFESLDREIDRLARDRDLLDQPARRVTPAIRHAEESVEKAKQSLKDAAPETADDAIRLLKMAIDPVEDAASELRSLRSRAKSERRRNEKRYKDSSRGGKFPTAKKKVKSLN